MLYSAERLELEFRILHVSRNIPSRCSSGVFLHIRVAIDLRKRAKTARQPIRRRPPRETRTRARPPVRRGRRQLRRSRVANCPPAALRARCNPAADKAERRVRVIKRAARAAPRCDAGRDLGFRSAGGERLSKMPEGGGAFALPGEMISYPVHVLDSKPRPAFGDGD
ncbi:hypothetical protein EVAR_22326_1 [Eumeta japonica]|uniref:Uncharacterized protein n=1 Tax=Eumeta variegata TaxID=151549 RepID=A0A4C1UBY8_EUMVA|nr:hypothetical protein EVAR_22326_1 [Eumeta japonica]